MNKEKQLELLLEINPMTDDYHTGIRKLEDIKSFKEAVNDDIKDEEIGAYPDFSKEDALKAIESGYITIYSSHPIENGVFVTPSKMNAQDYAGGNKVYSKKVPLDEVAWINSDEGEYAKVSSLIPELKDIAENRDNGLILFTKECSTELVREFLNSCHKFTDNGLYIEEITNDTLDGLVNSTHAAIRKDPDVIFIDSQLKRPIDEDNELAKMAFRCANVGEKVVAWLDKVEDVKELDKTLPNFKEQIVSVYDGNKLYNVDELFSEVKTMNLEAYKEKIQSIDAYEDEDSLINVLVGTSIIDMAERDGFTEINDSLIENVEASMAGYIREAIDNTLDEAYDKLFSQSLERE